MKQTNKEKQASMQTKEANKQKKINVFFVNTLKYLLPKIMVKIRKY